ncbi:MAG: outer membrane lipoprotein carrier protein LolA [Elusimicrobia bacterium]|nr:outer membrane lipoprotein carrier protein LolA [Elusimicrobiota bacterium]
MKLLLCAVLLALPAAASAAGRKAAPKKNGVAVSTAAAGTPLYEYAVSSAPLTLDLIAARFGEVDGRMKTLKATFRQFVRVEDADSVQQVEGEVSFRKPDLMRLTHSLPEPQTVVSDGVFLWVYRPSTNQVIQRRVEEWRRKEPLAKGLLEFGKSADLLSKYDAAVSTVSAPGADGHRTFVVALTPKAGDKGDSDFVLTLKASDKDFFPGEATLRVGRASIRSTFENVRLNPEFPDETFRFSPPPGADVFSAPDKP